MVGTQAAPCSTSKKDRSKNKGDVKKWGGKKERGSKIAPKEKKSVQVSGEDGWRRNRCWGEIDRGEVEGVVL